MKDAKSQTSILVCKHFNRQNRNFQETRILLKRRENFWVLKLKTLYPEGLNQELNNMKLIALLLHSTSRSNDTFSADWNDKQNLGNLISEVKFEI